MKRITVLTTLAAMGFAASAWAQTPVPQQQAPNMPAPKDMPAEKVDPSLINPTEPSTTGSTDNLSEKLQQSDGVIRPPNTGTPDMRVPAPVPNPGTTPVIPAPGSPGGNQSIDPK
ncbi:hypothetical protein [Microvirga pudoricolor]|uniref:hypothetical protein n=1 Tax=Microvirga pudoricolor TaxID=2778729 RepID=UPI00194F0FC4|nr:hypothetical protein [Microvirga pudoricolor]MBM6596266.1 hypothetical protein [Microvirga pudoricolor]